MTILIVMPFPLTDVGGVTTYVTQLQDGLNGRGHRALLMVPGGDDWIAGMARPAIRPDAALHEDRRADRLLGSGSVPLCHGRWG